METNRTEGLAPEEELSTLAESNLYRSIADLSKIIKELSQQLAEARSQREKARPWKPLGSGVYELANVRGNGETDRIEIEDDGRFCCVYDFGEKAMVYLPDNLRFCSQEEE